MPRKAETGDVALVMSEAGINIDSVYVTIKSFSASMTWRARFQIAGGMVVMTVE